MQFSFFDILIVAFYLSMMVAVGWYYRRKATKNRDSFFLADRNVPWWMLSIAGCSSYIDIGGTMAMIGAMYYLGLKSIWITHIFWGWFMIAGYMAYQAKYIRRSGVMTFAEWNQTRFGDKRDAEMARIASATFLLVLMIFNLIFIAVGIGKFAEAFLPIPRWSATLTIFLIVGTYVTLAGFFGVILTDILQTFFILVAVIILSFLALSTDTAATILENKPEGWLELAPVWNLWEGYNANTPESYQHFYLFGPILVAGFSWMMFRVLAGPNVWDFQFFLTTRSARDAALAAGFWTVAYVMRWILALSFLVLGIIYVKDQQWFDAEMIMPVVLTNLPAGLQGFFLATLLAALMSTLSAMVNVTSSVVTNDFMKRYFAKRFAEKKLVRVGQWASAFALLTGFLFSIGIDDVISAWETMIFVIVTMILVPATFRWHWWRYSAKAFVFGMIGSALVIMFQLVFLGSWPVIYSLPFSIVGSLVVNIFLGFYFAPAETDTLVKFYSRVMPFGFWGPIREQAIGKGLVERNNTPLFDFLNLFLSFGFQLSIALIPFYWFLGNSKGITHSILSTVALSIILYFTWYKKLPSRDEGLTI
jgi:solute:Na+ symporter, SSS family